MNKKREIMKSITLLYCFSRIFSTFALKRDKKLPVVK